MKQLSTLIRLTLISLIYFGFAFTASASHYAGTDLYYQCLGGNQYRVTLVFYRDCEGINEPTTADITLSNLCTGGQSTISLPKKPNSVNFTNGIEISSTCSGVLSTCNGGTAPGLRKWVYEGIVNVTTGCPDWKLSYELCCRNNAITTLQNPGSESLYTEAVLRSDICDNAPQFSNNPIAFACVNQAFNYNQGAFDPDGDLITYELDDPLSASGVPVAFAAGYSKTNPFATSSGFSLSAVTGAVNFTPNALQVGVFAVKVKQFRNGNLIGYVRRDMQIFVTNCNSNNLPVASGFNGTSNYSVDVCAGSQFCGTINSSDPDAGQAVTLTWNQGISGATFTVGAGNLPSADFCWTPTNADIATNPHVFTVTVKDNACPTNGEQTFSYVVNVIGAPAITFNSTDAQCASNNGSATAIATGNISSYLWSNGVTTAANNGLSAGTYTVTVTNSTGCSSSSSVTIGQSGSNLNLSANTTDDNGSCNGAIDLTVSGGTSPFSYTWSDGSTTEDIANLCAGTYTVNVTDANGCSAAASYTVNTSGGGCKIKLTLKSNEEGMCKSGGIINGIATGMSGKGTVILYNSNGGVIGQKSFTKTFGFANLQQGTYSVLITDQQGCTATGTVVVAIGNCGAPINVQAINITSTSAKIVWNHCGSTKHVVRYKKEGAGNAYTIVAVSNINELQLNNLDPNTRYIYSVKSNCGKGKYSLYTLNKKFCTGNCTVPKIDDEVDLDVTGNAYAINYSINPNPSSDMIKLVGESSTLTNAVVTISNLVGKTVLTREVELDTNFEISISISELPKGVYMININGFDNAGKRFIKL